MSGIRMLALVLIVGGVTALSYHGFTYFGKSHSATVGSLELSVKEKHTVVIPVGASVGAIAIGTALLALGMRKS